MPVSNPVWINNKTFTIPDPTSGSQKLDKDATAAFWQARFGGNDGPLIGIPANTDGSFYYFHQNAVDVIVDVLVGFVPTLPPEGAKDGTAKDSKPLTPTKEPPPGSGHEPRNPQHAS